MVLCYSIGIFFLNIWFFNFDTRGPKTTHFIWRLIDFFFVAELLLFYFVPSRKNAVETALSLAIYFWEVWLSSLLIQEAPEQMWIEKGVAKEECTYFQFLKSADTVYETLSS